MRMLMGLIAVAGLGLAGCQTHHITMGEVPAAARATIEREAAGGTVNSVERETRNGQVQYEADVTVNGHKKEVKVDESGRLISSH